MGQTLIIIRKHFGSRRRLTCFQDIVQDLNHLETVLVKTQFLARLEQVQEEIEIAGIRVFKGNINGVDGFGVVCLVDIDDFLHVALELVADAFQLLFSFEFH